MTQVYVRGSRTGPSGKGLGVKWRRGTGAGQVEDYRRSGGGGLSGIPMGKAGGGGLGLIVLLAIFLLTGGLPGGGGSSGFPIDLPAAGPPASGGEAPPASDDEAQFVQFVVADVQGTWKKIFAEGGQTYEPTTLRLFSSGIQTGCGAASSATGPFYCPPDRHVYIDLTFFRELQSRFQAAGDFAQAYVIAHEFGHHVQNLLGVSDDVNRQQQEDPESANELSVRLELQADCLAGIWGHSARQEGLLEPRRPRGGPERGRGRRRRPDPEPVRPRRQPRDVDARLLRAADELVPEGVRERRPVRLRHVQGRRLVPETRAMPEEHRDADVILDVVFDRGLLFLVV